jgi:hypothetical protein
LGTLITIAFDVAAPPAPPLDEKKEPLPVWPPPPPTLVALAEPVPVLSAALVVAVALALPPVPPFV